jgi:hypothetical protein
MSVRFCYGDFGTFGWIGPSSRKNWTKVLKSVQIVRNVTVADLRVERVRTAVVQYEGQTRLGTYYVPVLALVTALVEIHD